MPKNKAEGRKCHQFYCDHRGDRWCCKDCPDPCRNRCLNHPAKCGLVEIPGPPKPRRYKFDTVLARKHYDQGWTDASIARELGCSGASIRQWRLNEGLSANNRRREEP